jgi:hypothetical protein
VSRASKLFPADTCGRCCRHPIPSTPAMSRNRCTKTGYYSSGMVPSRSLLRSLLDQVVSLCRGSEMEGYSATQFWLAPPRSHRYLGALAGSRPKTLGAARSKVVGMDQTADRSSDFLVGCALSVRSRAVTLKTAAHQRLFSASFCDINAAC